jgi:hypothetical protein
MRSMYRVVTVLALVFAVALMASAQTKEGAKGQPSPEDQQKMMAAMMAAMKPGPQHDVLAKMAGDWTVTGKMWMNPKEDPMPMDPGTEYAEMILGGRYLQSVMNGKMMGMPYEGHGLMGYDNVKKQYQITYVDNMGTAISTGTGTADATGKIISLMGKMDDPSTGKMDSDVKYVYTIKDDKTFVFEMYGPAPTGGLVKMMEMTYVKK